MSHTVSRNRHTFVCSSGWDNPEGKAEIAAWLKIVANEQVKMYRKAIRNSEAALYPLIITALLPVFGLCDCSALSNVVNTMEKDDIEQLALSLIHI